MQSFKVARFERNGTVGTGLVLEDGRLFDLVRAVRVVALATGRDVPHFREPQDLMEEGLFKAEFFAEVLDFSHRHGLLEAFSLQDGYRLLAPVARPQKIVCLGRNYAEHARESGAEPPEEPIIFPKAPSAIIGPEEEIVIPEGIGRVDPEVEIAVVIGKRCKSVAADRAGECIAGFTILNDVTARDMQSRDLAEAKPWFRSKSLDTFCPLGPWIVVGLPPSPELKIELRVNGEVRQSANTREMIFKPPELIEFISGHMTLLPGDIIATGTPAGIAPIKPGDVVECEVEGIGLLRNPVVAG